MLASRTPRANQHPLVSRTTLVGKLSLVDGRTVRVTRLNVRFWNLLGHFLPANTGSRHNNLQPQIQRRTKSPATSLQDQRAQQKTKLDDQTPLPYEVQSPSTVAPMKYSIPIPR